MASHSDLTTRCYGCGRNIRYPTKLIGALAKCPQCKTQISLPGSTGANSTVELDGAETKGTSTSGSRSRQKTAKLRSLGRYTLLRRLGAGGFGEVWEATDSHLSRKVAIKLPLFHASDAKRIRRFLTEGRAAAQLRHPNIVGVYDAGETYGQYYLAIEFVSGQSLSQLAATRKFTQREAARLISKCAKALQYAHNNRILHRDIKPANIVLNELNEPQILDFGLARLEDEIGRMTLDGTVLGTPAYMSPEQATGDLKRIGPQSDQYSLGATLYWLLTGKPLFEGPSAIILAQVVNSPPVPPQSLVPGLDSALNAICLKSISKSPEDRYINCLEFAKDLDRFLNDEAILARPDGFSKHALRWCKRNPIDLTLGASLVAVLLISFSISIAGWLNANRNARLSVELEMRKEKQLLELEDTHTRLNEEVSALDRLTVEAREAEDKSKELETASLRMQNELQIAIQENQRIEQEAKRNQKEAEENQSQVTRVQVEADSLRHSAQSQEKEYQSQLRERTPRELLIEKYSHVFELTQEKKWEQASEELTVINSEQSSSFHSAYLTRLIQNQGKIRISSSKFPSKSGPVCVDEFDQTLNFRTKPSKGTHYWCALDTGTILAQVAANETQVIYDRTTNTIVCVLNGRTRNVPGSAIRIGKAGEALASIELPVYVEYVYFNSLNEPLAVCRSPESQYSDLLSTFYSSDTVPDSLLILKLTPQPTVAWNLAQEPLFEANFAPERVVSAGNRRASRIAIGFPTRNHPRWLTVKYIDQRLFGQLNLEFSDSSTPETVKLVEPTVEKWDTLASDPPFPEADVRDSVWFSEGVPLLRLDTEGIPEGFSPTHQFISTQYVILMDKQQFIAVQYIDQNPFEK